MLSKVDSIKTKLVSKVDSVKTKLGSKLKIVVAETKAAVKVAVSTIRAYVSQMSAPGVYRETTAQDTLEWIAMATVIIAVIAIFAAIIRAIVANRSQQIDSSWPA